MRKTLATLAAIGVLGSGCGKIETVTSEYDFSGKIDGVSTHCYSRGNTFWGDRRIHLTQNTSDSVVEYVYNPFSKKIQSVTINGQEYDNLRKEIDKQVLTEANKKVKGLLQEIIQPKIDKVVQKL